MVPRIDSLLVLLAASAAMAAIPGDGRGQAGPALKSPREPDSASDQRLEARAAKVSEEGRTGWERAANLYTRAAELRGPGDPRAAEDLVVAGHMFYYAGRHEASLLAFRAAGRLLLGLGNLQAASGAFRDGAWVAQQAGLTEQAEQLCRWSEVLLREQRQGGESAQRRAVAGLARRS